MNNKYDLVDYISSDTYKPCCVCGKFTNRIEINYEAYVCSMECERVLNSQMWRGENDHEERDCAK